MARNSTLPSFKSQAAATRAILANEAGTVRARDLWKGNQWTALLLAFFASDPRCGVCGLPTIATRWHGPQAARLGLVIPSALLMDGLRARDLIVPTGEPTDIGVTVSERYAHRTGWVNGNVFLSCMECEQRGNAWGLVNGPRVLSPRSMAVPSSVWLSWPRLGTASLPVAPTGQHARALHDGMPAHISRSRAARAANGLPY